VTSENISTKTYFIVFLTLLSLLFATYIFSKSKTSAEFLQLLGEKSFLSLHLNKISVRLLEASKAANHEDYKTYFLLGRVYFVEGRMEDSIRNYSVAIKLNPNHKESYYGRGLTYGFTSSIFYPEAKRDFEKYIEIDRQEFEKTGSHAYGAWAGYNDLAWVYYLMGEWKQAEEVARAGLEITQSNPWLSNMLGAILLEQNRCEEAIEELEKADLLLGAITSDQFGEAYSGDNPKNWGPGKESMAKAIKENLELCKSFPQ